MCVDHVAQHAAHWRSQDIGGVMQWPYAQAKTEVGKTAWQTYIEPRLPRKATQLPWTAGFFPRKTLRCFPILEAAPCAEIHLPFPVQKLNTQSKH